MKSVQVRNAFKPLAAATAMACAALLAAPAQAQFAERTIRMSNGINQDHPVGNGVAMGGAPDAVRAAARYTAPSCEEDGAAQMIERLILDAAAE